MCSMSIKKKGGGISIVTAGQGATAAADPERNRKLRQELPGLLGSAIL